MASAAEASGIYRHDPGELVAEFASFRLVLERPEWHAEAACRGVGTELFFNGSPAARAYCDRCAVVADCLAAGIENDETGRWGGLVDRERRRRTRAGRSAA